jgi:hypothetical protein
MTARIVGVLFIIGTVAGVLSAVVTGPVLAGPNPLAEIAANQNQMIVGALLVLTMGLALTLVPVLMFSIFGRQSEALALGYVVFRGGLEGATYLAVVALWLLLIALGQQYATVGAPDASTFRAFGTMLMEASDSINLVLTPIIFSLGALVFYVLSYQSRLIPRWLSIWGLVGAALNLALGLSAMFGLPAQLPILEAVLAIPIALNEMVLAVWLIAKGLGTSAIRSSSARLAAVGE